MFALRRSEDDQYRPFPREQGRDDTQESVEVPLLLALLEPRPGQRVLEIGCGGGSSLAPLARLCRPARLVGLDLDADLLAVARARLATQGVSAELVPGDARRLPFDDEAFDLVFDFGTCYHIARPHEALREIARVLRPGGRLVVESRLNQWTSHPIRSARSGLPWSRVPALVRRRRSLMWQVWERVS
jgi:ubiquinone/menaquinone biosynthesis C-methylase UbiE